MDGECLFCCYVFRGGWEHTFIDEKELCNLNLFIFMHFSPSAFHDFSFKNIYNKKKAKSRAKNLIKFYIFLQTGICSIKYKQQKNTNDKKNEISPTQMGACNLRIHR